MDDVLKASASDSALPLMERSTLPSPSPQVVFVSPNQAKRQLSSIERLDLFHKKGWASRAFNAAHHVCTRAAKTIANHGNFWHVAAFKYAAESNLFDHERTSAGACHVRFLALLVIDLD